MTDTMQNDFLEEPKPKESSGFSLGSLVLIVGLVAVAVVVGIQLMQQNQTQPQDGAAPDFTVTTFDGETMSLADLRGKVVVLNFWASWCVPCRLEAPALQSVWERYQDQDVVILGVAYADNGPKSLEFIEEFGMTYPNAPDLGTRISDAYNIQGVPETFIIDQNGEVAEFIYAGVTEEQLITSIERLLVAQ